MKRMIAAMALACAFTLGARAQDVFNEIYHMAEQTANNKANTIDERKLATFKMDALTYMKTKTLDGMMAKSMQLADTLSATTVTILNYQAYALYQFVNLSVKQLSKQDTNRGLAAVRKRFRDASLAHPYYHDLDRELVNAYVDNKNYNTPFSLDTDWVKALEEVKKK